jgi:hypothetical protein
MSSALANLLPVNRFRRPGVTTDVRHFSGGQLSGAKTAALSTPGHAAAVTGLPIQCTEPMMWAYAARRAESAGVAVLGVVSFRSQLAQASCSS